MGNKPASSGSPGCFCVRKPRVKSIGNGLLPRNLARIVGEYLSNSSSDYAESVLSGVQPITLRLSQVEKSPIGSCWDLGFLSPEHRWIPNEERVDMELRIDDLQGDQVRFTYEDGTYSPLVIDVLVVSLNMTSYLSSNALYGLRRAITALREQLKSVNHVVISMTKYASCCFSFKDVIGTRTRGGQPIDRSRALFKIVDDLDACWKKDWLTADSVFAFYFESKVKPASETYLVKFVLELFRPPYLTLLEKKAFNAVSNKLMWACSLTTSEVDFRSIPNTPQLWRAIYCEVPALRERDAQQRSVHHWKPDFRSETSSFIERIHLHDGYFKGKIKLPQPRASLAHAGLHSALIELSLFGDSFSLHLTQLNTGYFPNLAFLTLVGVKISGHLDSHFVPNLKALRIEPKSFTSKSLSFLGPILSRRQQSIIKAGYSWQLVAAQDPGGWSLASYEERVPNPHEDVKEDSPHPLPLIRDLLLVVENQKHADQWQSQLDGNPSVEAVADDHNDRILMWSPECVQKITVFGAAKKKVLFDFTKIKLKETPILTSLHCLNVLFPFEGFLFPYLQLLKMNSCDMKLCDIFPSLQTLVIIGGCLEWRWQVDAPSLRSIHCENLKKCANFSFVPLSMSHLSSLYLKAKTYESGCYPQVFVDEDSVGFSNLRFATLYGELSNYSFFNPSLVQKVSHLVLDIDPNRLPKFWRSTTWLCDEFYVFVHVRESEKKPRPGPVVLPKLPLVKKLTVKEDDVCRAVIDREMLGLTDLTVPSPESLGRNLKCPALQRIRFTGELSKKDKEKCLNLATYIAIFAQPREVIFDFHDELHTLSWDVDLAEYETPPVDVLLKDAILFPFF